MYRGYRDNKKWIICLIILGVMFFVLCIKIMLQKLEIQKFKVQPAGEAISKEEVNALLEPLEDQISGFTVNLEMVEEKKVSYAMIKTTLEEALKKTGENEKTVFEKLSCYQDLENRYEDDFGVVRDDFFKIYDELIAKYGLEEKIVKTQVFVYADTSQIDKERTEVWPGNGILTTEGVFLYGTWSKNGMQALYAEDSYLYKQAQLYLYEGTVLTIESAEYIEKTEENAFLLEPEDGLFYMQGFFLQYEPEIFAGCEREQVMDLTYGKKEIKVREKKDKVSGKVLRVDEDGIEIEDIGYLSFQDGYKVYDLVDPFCEKTKEDVVIGYSFTDFVMEDGKVTACLIARKEKMDTIRVLIKGPEYSGKYYEELTFCFSNEGEIILPDGEKVTVKGQDSYHLVCSDYTPGERIYIKNTALTATIKISEVLRSQGNASYRGDFEAYVTEDGFLLINEVPLEQYLYAVVPSEMPSSYAKEALKSQAICARTYAYKRMLHAGYKQYGTHVDDSAAYQVYQNIQETTSTTDAVKETQGQILVYQDQPAETYYYSTSYGFGSSIEVWNGNQESDAPYLTPVAISLNPKEEARQLMEEEVFRKKLDSVDLEDYESTNPWYRWTYTVKQLKSDTILERLQYRYGLNEKLVLTKQEDGTYQSKPVETIGEILNISITKRLPGGNAQECVIEGTENTFKVLTEMYIRSVLCDGTSYVERMDGSVVEQKSLLPSGFLYVENIYAEEAIEDCFSNVIEYIVHGGGFGHGVGMSQNAAGAMAQKGKNSEEILTFFYQGCEVKKLEE